MKYRKSWTHAIQEVRLEEDAKMGRQSDDQLKKLYKDWSSKDQSSPATKSFTKRIEKEMKQRKILESEIKEEVFNWYIIKGTSEKGKIAHVGSERELKLKIRKPTFPSGHVLLKSRKDLHIGDAWKGSMGVSEEVELEEEVTAIDYDRLKRGDIITIEFKSAMSSGKSKFKVTAKNIVGKAKVGKVTLQNLMNPKGVKHFLYKRGNSVSFAQGDMAASVMRYTIEQVELDEALKPADKKVLDAFYNKHRSHVGKLLDTDGKSLDKVGMGGQQIAVWKGDKIKITAVSDVKSTEEILRALKKSIPSGLFEEVEIDEKKGSDYELYHKTFSDAMQHAYDHAKKKGFIVDPKEIDDKVATGPKKPSSGKTNRYILGTNKKKNVHIQVANLDNKKYELNMYIEEKQPKGEDMSQDLITTARTVMTKEDSDPDEPGKQGDEKEYQKKRDEVLKKYGVTACALIKDEKTKKQCFKDLDDAHVGDHEEGYQYNPHPPEGKPTSKKLKPNKGVVKSPTEEKQPSKLFSHIRNMMKG